MANSSDIECDISEGQVFSIPASKRNTCLCFICLKETLYLTGIPIPEAHVTVLKRFSLKSVSKYLELDFKEVFGKNLTTSPTASNPIILLCPSCFEDMTALRKRAKKLARVEASVYESVEKIKGNFEVKDPLRSHQLMKIFQPINHIPEKSTQSRIIFNLRTETIRKCEDKLRRGQGQGNQENGCLNKTRTPLFQVSSNNASFNASLSSKATSTGAITTSTISEIGAGLRKSDEVYVVPKDQGTFAQAPTTVPLLNLSSSSTILRSLLARANRISKPAVAAKPRTKPSNQGMPMQGKVLCKYCGRLLPMTMTKPNEKELHEVIFHCDKLLFDHKDPHLKRAQYKKIVSDAMRYLVKNIRNFNERLYKCNYCEARFYKEDAGRLYPHHLMEQHKDKVLERLMGIQTKMRNTALGASNTFGILTTHTPAAILAWPTGEGENTGGDGNVCILEHGGDESMVGSEILLVTEGTSGEEEMEIIAIEDAAEEKNGKGRTNHAPQTQQWKAPSAIPKPNIMYTACECGCGRFFEGQGNCKELIAGSCETANEVDVATVDLEGMENGDGIETTTENGTCSGGNLNLAFQQNNFNSSSLKPIEIIVLD